MKKTLVLLMAVSVVIASAQAKDNKAKKSKKDQPAVVEKVFTNDVDSMSYALGVNLGEDFAKNLKTIPGGKVNKDLLIKGFSTALHEDSTLIEPQKAKDYFRAYISKAQKEETDAKKAEGANFLAENAKNEGVKVTPSGLQYQVINEGTGPKPGVQDTVKVNYTGTLIDGKKFDSSVDRGEPIEFPLNQVIKGWTEGVQLMSVGAKYRFFVPYTLGYGEQGAGGVIPPYATLVFDVELLGVKPYKEPAPEAATTATAKDSKAVKSAPATKSKNKSKK